LGDGVIVLRVLLDAFVLVEPTVDWRDHLRARLLATAIAQVAPRPLSRRCLPLGDTGGIDARPRGSNNG
jgi:hypothetical protein